MSKLRKLPKGKRTSLDSPTLPAGFYRFSYQSANVAEVHSTERELVPRLVQWYIPKTLIKSLSLAIDPFWKFKVSPVKVTAVNRTRFRTIDSVLEGRQARENRISNTKSVAYTTPTGCVGVRAESQIQTLSTTNLGKQPGFTMTTKDTTARTRPAGSDLGEFEHFQIQLLSPTRNTSRRFTTATYNVSLVCPGTTGWTKNDDRRWYSNVGDAATLTKSSIDSLASTERTALLAEMQKKALGLLPKVLPDRRQYTLLRNAIELKDLPRSVLSLKRTMSDFKLSVSHISPGDVSKFITDLSVNLRNVPREYLSYSFGWRQIYKDLVGLMESPSKITRDLNNLIARRGKPSTFRFGLKYALDEKTTPDFSYAVMNGEVDRVTATKVTREVELRIMVNAIFDFPILAVPDFYRQEWLKKLGVLPTVTDVYNLTPWTWLVDWFTGLGQYVEAIDSINTDRSTFNYGFLTGVLTGKVVTTYQSRVESTDSYSYVPNPSTVITTSQRYNHSSVAEYRVKIRKDLASAYGAKPIATSGVTLSSYQQSILGALLLERSRLLRTH